MPYDPRYEYTQDYRQGWIAGLGEFIEGLSEPSWVQPGWEPDELLSAIARYAVIVQRRMIANVYSDDDED